MLGRDQNPAAPRLPEVSFHHVRVRIGANRSGSGPLHTQERTSARSVARRRFLLWPMCSEHAGRVRPIGRAKGSPSLKQDKTDPTLIQGD